MITGCSTGVGRALAEAFAKRGRPVIATARRLSSIADLEGPHCTLLELDVTDSASIDRAVSQAEEAPGGVGTLINNAGWGLMGPVAELKENDLRRQFETNVVGPVALISRVVPNMAKRGSGMIVNVGSVSGLTATPFAGAYCASKAAIHSLTDSLRLELAPLGISVVCIQGGAVRSSFGDTASSVFNGDARPDSLFASHAKAIQDRARASDLNGMDPRDFAARVVNQLERTPPRSIIRLGPLARKMAILRLLPASLRDRLLSRKFGLRQA
jgi:short-subunit dehydrogenase